MRARTVALGFLSGIAGVLLVGVTVTELAAPAIEFSLFVGIPAGLIAGVAAAILVVARLEDPSPVRRRPALVVAGFALVFVVALFLGAGALGLPNSTAIPVAAVLGLFGGLAGYLSSKRTRSRL